MGNDNNRDKVEAHFRKTCHPGLVQCEYNEHEQLVYMMSKAQESMLSWRKDIEPLL